MWKKIVGFFKNWHNNAAYAKWLMQYTKPYIPKMIVVMLIQMVLTGISIGMALESKAIIDNAQGGHVAVFSVAVYGVMIILNLLLTVISSLISVMLNEKFSFGIRKTGV